MYQWITLAVWVWQSLGKSKSPFLLSPQKINFWNTLNILILLPSPKQTIRVLQDS